VLFWLRFKKAENETEMVEIETEMAERTDSDTRYSSASWFGSVEDRSGMELEDESNGHPRLCKPC